MATQLKRLGSPVEQFTRMMFTRIITALAGLLRDEGLSLGHIAALHLIDQHGTLRVSDIAEQLGLSVSAASRLVEGLVQRELVSRTEDTEDRRIKSLALTREGTAFVDRISEDRVRVIFATAEELPTQLVQSILSGVQKYTRR